MGAARAHFDEFGGSEIELVFEDIRTDFSPMESWGEFFWPGEYVEQEGAWTWSLGLRNRSNPCTRFVLTTADGVFTSTGEVVFVDNRSGKLRFRIIQSTLRPLRGGQRVLGASIAQLRFELRAESSRSRSSPVADLPHA